MNTDPGVAARGSKLACRCQEELDNSPDSPETAGSCPAWVTQAPIVYGLGSGIFTPWDGVRVSVGVLRGREFGVPAGS